MRRSKPLVVGVLFVVVAGMMFAATTRGLYQSSVLSPLNRMATRDRSAVVEEPNGHQLYYVHVMQIDNVPIKDITAKLSSKLKSNGYSDFGGFGRPNSGDVYYTKGSLVMSSPKSFILPDSVMLAPDTPKNPNTVFVADLHRATTIEVLWRK